MSSYSSRYQSRLLNFISQQSRKAVDKCDRALRHLKFTAEVALQATLYPVYLLLQTARAMGKQLQQVGKKTAAQLGNPVKDESLNSPEAEAPVQRVLSFLQELSLPDSTTEEISAVNYRNTAPFSAPNLGDGQAELPVFKDLIATSADVLSKLDNKVEKAPDSGLLALAAAPEIPKSFIGDSMKLGLTHASAESLANLDKSLDSGWAPPEISTCVKRSYPEGNRTLIVGVATAIATRNLVLVAPENQTLDTLTAQQQQELQRKIWSEVADYWQQRQRLIESQLGLDNDLQLVANKVDLFSWFRQFLQVMSWVQTSPIAVKLNLFGEANLLLAKKDNLIGYYQLGEGVSGGFNEFQQLLIPPLSMKEPEESTESIPPLPSRKSKGILTDFISLFSTKSQEESTEFITPVPPLGKEGRDYQLLIANSSLTLDRGAIAPIAPSQESPQSQEEKNTNYLTVNSLGFLQTKQAQAEKIAQQQDHPTKLVGIEKFEEYFEQTVEAILSAITNFLGRKAEQSEREIAQHLYAKYQFPETLHPQLDTIKSDSTSAATELTWSDLFGETSYAPSSETEDLNPPCLTAKLGNNAQNLSQVNPAATVSNQQAIATAVAIAEQAENSSVKPAPDWWEAQVISRGYIKHPLEQALELLDKALLWLEEIGVQLWKWAKIQLDKILSSKN